MVLSVGKASGEDGNRVHNSCNRLNWGALDHASSAPQLRLLQLSLVYVIIITMSATFNALLTLRYFTCVPVSF